MNNENKNNITQRIEKDSMGSVFVENSKYWGAQTQRAIHNFKIGSNTLHPFLIRAFGIVKKCSAETNMELGLLDKTIGTFICQAAQEVASGRFNSHFPISVWQTGSGTQSNMNANEVIANVALEKMGHKKGSRDIIHPNDHVNMCQSSNDTFPTVMHVGATIFLDELLIPTVMNLHTELVAKEEEFSNIVKTGRTHMQDATPVTLGQEFSGYAAQIHACYVRLNSALSALMELAQGGTAVGTGINSHPSFANLFIEKIKKETNLPFKCSSNFFLALASHESYAFAHSAMVTVALAVNKICNDLRLMSSGPRCGLNEITLPANEPGSSIMPGKVNPTQIESLTMICTRIIGNHTTMMSACSQGHFELNVYKPLMAHTFMETAHLLNDGINSFVQKCLKGITPNEENMQKNLDKSLMLVTALATHIGYDKAAQVAHYAYTNNVSLKESCQKLDILNSNQTFEEIVDPKKMLKPSYKK